MLLQSQTAVENKQKSWSVERQLHVASEKILYWLGCSVVGLFARSMLELDVSWRSPLPSGSKIIAANHPTTLDPFLILTLAPTQTSVLVTGGAFQVPVFGHYLQRAGHVPVIRGHGRAAFEKARQLLEAGRTIGIFPEGALSPLEGGVHEPRTGAARLSLSTGAPVIPVGIHLQRECVRSFGVQLDGEPVVGRFYLRGPYAMTVGEPLHFKGEVQDRECVRSVSECIMQRIVSLSQESARRIEASQALAAVTKTSALELANAG